MWLPLQLIFHVTMPVCVYCGANLKTRCNLARHHGLLHEGKSLGNGHVPEKFTLRFFVNLVQQTLSCPIGYCSYKRDKCKDVRSIAVHFTRSHPHHKLCVSYFCQRCNFYIDPSERREHNKSHIEQDRLGGPFSPPTPVIDPNDYSLSYVRSPKFNTTQEDVDISLQANPNGSLISSLSPPAVSPTPSMHPAPFQLCDPSSVDSSPLTSSPVSPVVPSADNVLAGNAFLPSPPSPTLLDPTTPAPLFTSAMIADDHVPCLSQSVPSSNEVIACSPILPSQITPEFLEPCIGDMDGTEFLDSPNNDNFSPDLFPSLSPSQIEETKSPRRPNHEYPASYSSPSTGSSPLPVCHDSILSLSPNDSPSRVRDLLGCTSPAIDCIPTTAVREHDLQEDDNGMVSDVRKIQLCSNMSDEVIVISDAPLPSTDLRHTLCKKRVASTPQSNLVTVASESPTGLPEGVKNDPVKRRIYLENCKHTIEVLKKCFRRTVSSSNTARPSVSDARDDENTIGKGLNFDPVQPEDVDLCVIWSVAADSSIRPNSSDSGNLSSVIEDSEREVGIVAPPPSLDQLSRPLSHQHDPVSHRKVPTREIMDVIANARPPPGVSPCETESNPDHESPVNDDDLDPDAWIPAAQ